MAVKPRIVCLPLLLITAVTAIAAYGQEAPEPQLNVRVLAGPEATMEWLESPEGWGGVSEDPSLGVPYVLITAINPRWSETAKSITVQQKKQLFYRFMLPLILHANGMIMDRRERVLAMQTKLESGEPLSDDDIVLLRNALTLLGVTDDDAAAAATGDSPELGGWLDEILYRLDEIPAGLALGQAAYESGYGTSRFALQGNALFGQWTYGGEGLKPEQQRTSSLGDHRIAAFDWPFDSVRGYFINLMSHRAYEDFRRLRAQQRTAGEPLDSLVLADGLTSYSERGQEYVNTLKGMIRHNGLDRADGAELRGDEMQFIVVAEDAEAAAQMEQEIEGMRESGELRAIYERMRLE